eukprot:TRINITY_DN139_c0_g1_i1.p1 TRINITY_DN139_c0_g1~~TRINITY_DN139_c0_g1_i1.p1  ORF type:complete len:3458 (+),score=831.05 TRINITY_DN139_c0_g1_i1:619-10374(+)
MAGLDKSHYQVISSSSDATVGEKTCYTIITEPHWDSGYKKAIAFNKNIAAFLNGGGNFFGQCEGIDVFENCQITGKNLVYDANPPATAGTKCNGLLLTEYGLDTGSQYSQSQFGDKVMRYNAPATAFAQMESFIPQTGWIESFRLRTGSNGVVTSPFKAGTGSHFVISSNSGSNIDYWSFSAHGKMPQYVGKNGGNVFYLGGHSYATSSKTYEGGQRQFLNAMLHPAYRPHCSLDIPPQDEEMECVLFDPYEHASFIFTPGCIPHITLDPGVGSSTKSCDQFIALPPGWEIVEMTTTTTNSKLDPAETQIIQDYGAAWASNCIAGIVPGQTPNPVKTTPSPSGTWTGYLSDTTTPTKCSTFTVNDTVVDTNTGRRCYQVSCGTTLLIRYPQVDATCNANNYGQFCDPKSGSDYYTSTLAEDASTIYINLAGTAPLQVPLSVPLYHQTNIYTIIDSFNVVSDSSTKDMQYVASALVRAGWAYSSYKARAIGIGYNDKNGKFQPYVGLSWSDSLISIPTNWAPAVTTATTSPILLTLTQAASTSLSWSSDTFRQFWVVTKSNPTTSYLANLVTAFGDNGPAAGTFIIFVTTSPYVSSYQSVCNSINNGNGAQRCSVATISEYPANTVASAKTFMSAIWEKEKAMIGTLTVKEVSDPYNFAAPVATTWLNSYVANAPTFATNTTPGIVNFYNYYPTSPVAFTLPTGWVGPSSTALLPLTIKFKTIETGYVSTTIVSWNEPPDVTKVPTVSFTFKDTDSTPFTVTIVDSIRSAIDPNFNLLKIKFWDATFSKPSEPWVNTAQIIGTGSVSGASFPLPTFPSGGTQWYEGLLGLKIWPKSFPGGVLTLKYQISDNCLVSGNGTITINYIVSNTPPTALPVVRDINAGANTIVNLRDFISDYETAKESLVIQILAASSSSLGSLKYKAASGSYTDLKDYTIMSTLYKDLQFVAGNTGGSVVYNYRVYDSEGKFADSTITININTPPTITINPATVTTAPTTTGTWTVTLSDTPADILTLYLEERVISPATPALSTSIVTSMTSANPVGSSVNLLTVSTGAIISSIAVPSSKTVSISQNWVPALAYPYGSRVSLTFYVVDSKGLRSLTNANVVLTIPDNLPPVWRATNVVEATLAFNQSSTASSWTYEFPQNVDKVKMNIDGDDPNLADTEKLFFTVTSFPTKGALYYVNSAGSLVAVSSASPNVPLAADKSTSSDGKTSFSLIYIPDAATASASAIVSDSYKGYWTDPAGAKSTVSTVNLVFTLINKKPTCISGLTFTATQGVPFSFSIGGSDPDGNLKTLSIASTDFSTTTATTQLTDSTSASVFGAAMPKTYTSGPSGSLTWTFTYATSYYASPAKQDKITYTVKDSEGLESSVCTVTITTTVVNQPPVAVGASYVIDEAQTLTIPFNFTQSTSSDPTYFDVDGSIAKTTTVIVTSLVSSLPGTTGTLTNAGSAVVVNQPSAKFVGSEFVLVYTAPANVARDTSITVTFQFQVSDSPDSPLVSKSSNIATVSIQINAVDNPPVIRLTPSLVSASAADWPSVKTFTVTVEDIDSDVAEVRLTDISIPWPLINLTDDAPVSIDDQTNLTQVPTLTITGSGDIAHSVYYGDTVPTSQQPNNELIITLTKSGGVFPSFYISWDSRNRFTDDATGDFSLVATADGDDSDPVTGSMQFTFQPPSPIAPTVLPVFIVVEEDSCVLGCVPSWVPLVTEDANTQNITGDVLSVYLTAISTTIPGKFVYNAPAGAKAIDIPTTFSSGFQSTYEGTMVWELSFEPTTNINSGSSCTCNAGAVSIADCMNCSPVELSVRVVDSTGLEATTTVQVVILPLDDAPLSQSIVKKANRTEELSITIPASDVDGDVVCIEFLAGAQLFDNPTLTFDDGTQVNFAAGAKNFCVTQGSEVTFDFTFLSSSTNAVSNVYPFKVVDANGNSSPDYTITVTLDRTPLPPTSTGATFSTEEDNPVEIPFTYKVPDVDNQVTYVDPDGSKPATLIEIVTIPTNGTLYGPDGQVIVPGTRIYTQDPVFSFVPNKDFNGDVSFEFISVDSEELKSDASVVYISVTPVDDPPTITLDPVSLVLNRTVTGQFKVTVNDVDSYDIAVIIQEEAGVPLFKMPELSTFQRDGADVPSSGIVHIIKLTTLGEPESFYLDWTPLVSIPDSATGSFTFYAANDNTETGTEWDGPVSVSSVTGTVGVLSANLPPFVVEDAEFPYSFAEEDGKWTEHAFHLKGSDPDDIHADILTITITGIPEGVKLVSWDDKPLSVGDVLSSPGTTVGEPHNDDDDDLATFALVKIVPDGKFYGNTSFSFFVTDPVGATSDIQVVEISITQKQVPPVSSDVVLVLPEDYCVTSSCGVSPTYNILSTLKYSTISATDENGGQIWLQFDYLPGESGSAPGTPVWFPFGTTDSDFSELQSVGPYSKGESVLAPTWDLWFQAPLDAHSELADSDTEPNSMAIEGVYYRPYTAIPFRVYDIDPRTIVVGFPNASAAADAYNAGDEDGCLDAVCESSDEEVCDDIASNAWICTKTPNITGHVSDTYYFRIYINPVNDPPTSKNEVFNIKEDDYTLPGDYLVIDLSFRDVDSDPKDIGVLTFGSTGSGFFYTRNGTDDVHPVPVQQTVQGDFIVPADLQLLFQPVPNTFSAVGSPYATLYFKVYDEALTSASTYTVTIYVESVPDAPVWVTDAEVDMLEDSSVLIALTGRDIAWSSFDSGNGVIFINEIGKGTFSQCSQTECVPIESGILPFPLTEGRITYVPLPDENGFVNGDGSVDEEGNPTYFYTSFKFTLWVYPGDSTFPASINDIPATAIPLEVNYRINVIPVNDPPVFVPLWLSDDSGLDNECDEDTFLRLRFTATDIDSDCNSLEADAMVVLESLQASLYTCASETAPECDVQPYICPAQEEGVPFCNSSLVVPENCVVSGNLVDGIKRIKKVGPAIWEVSLVPFRNWNGKLKLKFIVRDECNDEDGCDLFSELASVVVHVRPINDPPSIVAGASAARLEFYNDNRDAGKEWNPLPGQNREDYTLIQSTGHQSPIAIYEVNSDDAIEREGSLLEKYVPSVQPPKVIEDPSKPIVNVYRLTTKIQDVDFVTQYHLRMNSTLIGGSFVPQLMSENAPCTFDNYYTAECDTDIIKFNNFLSSEGFAVTIDDEQDSAVCLFLLNDTGNVDKLNRPLAAGFMIIVSRDPEEEEVLIPVAAIVILPVVAAATAASVAAAWLLLGQRAQEYAGASFDAFAATGSSSGTQSPLYDAQGREAISPLYQG